MTAFVLEDRTPATTVAGSECAPRAASLWMARRSRRRSGFTITELLVAMALIVFIMSILSEAFAAGASAFRNLKAIGDMAERLRAVEEARRLTQRIEAVEPRAWGFIENGLDNGKTDPEEAEALAQEYEAICGIAEELQGRLTEAERRTRSRGELAILGRSLDELERIKCLARKTVEILRLLE